MIPFNSTGRSSRTITLKALLDFTYTVTPSTYTPTGVTQDGSLANPYLLNLGNVDAEKQITINISDSIGDTRIRTSTTDVSVSGNTVQITSGLTTAPSDPIEIHIKDLISGTSSTTAAESAPANIYAEKTFYVKIVAPPAGFVYVQGNSTYTIPTLFFSDHEVTQGEFETDYTAATGSRVWYAHTVPGVYGDGDNYPVYDVSYYDALIYCNLRSMAEGLESCYSINNFTDPADWPDKTITSLTVGIAGPTTVNTNWDSVVVDRTKNGYRLPTEDEWLWAAKGGSAQESYTYSGGNDIDAVAWYSLNSGDGGGSTNNKSHPVKTKNPNSLGIYDMCGNVVELCDTPYSAVTNRVTRGGGYYHAAASANLNSGRNGTTSNVFYDRALGFRVVRTAP